LTNFHATSNILNVGAIHLNVISVGLVTERLRTVLELTKLGRRVISVEDMSFQDSTLWSPMACTIYKNASARQIKV